MIASVITPHAVGSQNVLRQTDQEISEMDKQIKEENKVYYQIGHKILMNEARNAIDLIIHAPEKVAEGYLSSLLASKAIQQFEKRHLEIREEAAPQEAVPPNELDQKMAEIELAMAQKNLELLDTQGDYMRP